VRKTVKLGIALLAVATVAGLAEPTAGASSARSINGAVTGSAIFAREQVFQKLADQNGGLRAAGEPGYQAAVNYVEKSLRSSGLSVKEQHFSFPYYKQLLAPVVHEISPATTFLDGSTFDYSGSGDVTGPVVPTTNIDGSTSGCAPADFPPITSSTPQVALIKRGTCALGDKVLNAQAAGYKAALVYNDGLPNRTDILEATIGLAVKIPVVGLSYSDGNALLTASRNGGSTIRVVTSTLNTTRDTENVIAETPGGDPNHVLVVDTQLDALPLGAGLVENASGDSTALEIAAQIHRLHLNPKYKIRFIFWGAETIRARRVPPSGEAVGQWGSYHYVNSLSASQLHKIYAAVNLNSLGAPNYVRFVTSGPDAASDTVASVFSNYFTSIGLASEPNFPNTFDGLSFGPLSEVGVPIGGLFGGNLDIKTADEAAVYGGTAGDYYDPCFHTSCDTISNVSVKALSEFGDAAMHGIWTLATTNVGGLVH